MMKPVWNEAMIARQICLHTFQRKCLLLVNNCNWTGSECDVLGVTMDGRIVDIEIKISRSDLKADAKKSKWWHSTYLGVGPEYEVVKTVHGREWRYTRRDPLYSKTARPHPDKVWKHYYCLPAAIWTDELLDSLPSKNSGVLLVSEKGGEFVVDCRRRAKPAKDAFRLSVEQALDIARLAHLRMWEAYAQANRGLPKSAAA